MLVVVVLNFIFVLHFVVVILHFIASYVMLFFSLLFDVIPNPSLHDRRIFTLILYFRPSPLQSDSQHIHFNLSEIFFSQFYRERYGFELVFFTHRRFLPYAPSPTFYLRVARLPWEPAVLPWSWQGFKLILENTDQIYLFVWIIIILILHTQNDSFLNSTKHYHELLVVKS